MVCARGFSNQHRCFEGRLGKEGQGRLGVDLEGAG